MKKRCLNYTVVKSLITFLLLVHFLSASTFVKAKVQLPSILSSNMVLQQHTNVKLWGKAQKNSPITIKTSWDCPEQNQTSPINIFFKVKSSPSLKVIS